MKVIKFAEDFPKLEEDYFSTIRKPPKPLRTGQICLIKSPSYGFKAILASERTEYICDISTRDLTIDTSTRSRDEALEVLRKFYPELGEASLVQVLWFVPVEEE
jgi:hypothetical protein